MENKRENVRQAAQVPYFVFEGTQARNERTIKRLIICVIIAVILLFASNAFWLYEWTQYDYIASDTDTTYTQDGGGYNNINTGEQGDITHGADLPKTSKTASED